MGAGSDDPFLLSRLSSHVTDWLDSAAKMFPRLCANGFSFGLHRDWSMSAAANWNRDGGWCEQLAPEEWGDGHSWHSVDSYGIRTINDRQASFQHTHTRQRGIVDAWIHVPVPDFFGVNPLNTFRVVL